MSTNNQALVPQPPTPPGALATNGFSSNLFAIRPANLQVVQGMSRSKKKGAQEGYFFNTKTNTNIKELDIVLLAIPQFNRCLFPPGEFGGKPICKSRDAVLPILDDDRLNPQAANCKNCDYGDKKWKEYFSAKKRGASKKELRDLIPPCRKQLEIYFADRGTLLPFRLNASGKSIQPTQQMLEGIAWLAQAARRDYPGVQPFWFTTKMTLERREDSSGVYFVTQYSASEMLPPDEIEVFEQQWNQIMARRAEMYDQAEAEGAEDAEMDQAVQA